MGGGRGAAQAHGRNHGLGWNAAEGGEIFTDAKMRDSGFPVLGFAPLPPAMTTPTRRAFLCVTAGAATALLTRAGALRAQGRSTTEPAAGPGTPFRLRHVLSTNQYGTLPIQDIVPEAKRAGYVGLDVWAGRWGNQREQIDFLGHENSPPSSSSMA